MRTKYLAKQVIEPAETTSAANRRKRNDKEASPVSPNVAAATRAATTQTKRASAAKRTDPKAKPVNKKGSRLVSLAVTIGIAISMAFTIWSINYVEIDEPGPGQWISLNIKHGAEGELLEVLPENWNPQSKTMLAFDPTSTLSQMGDEKVRARMALVPNNPPRTGKDRCYCDRPELRVARNFARSAPANFALAMIILLSGLPGKAVKAIKTMFGLND